MHAVMELFDRQCGRTLDLPGNVTAERYVPGSCDRQETGTEAYSGSGG